MSQTLTYVMGGDRRVHVKDIQDFKIDFSDDNHNWVQARQFERGMRQVFVNVTNEDGTPFDLTGCNVWFEGLLPKTADGDFRVIDDDGYVALDPSAGRFRFDMPGHAFTVAGSYRQAFFRIVKNGNSVTTLEFDLDVLADKVIDGLVPKTWIGPFEEIADKLVDSLQKHTDDADKILADFQKKVGDLIAQLNQQGSTTTSMLTELQNRITDLEAKIKQDGLFTQAEADQFKKSVLAVAINSFENVDVMSKSTNLAEGATVKTQGYYAKGDGGAATYKIVSAPTDFSIKLDNGLYADPVKEGVVTPNMFGARDNVKYQPSIDSTDAFRKALAFSDHVSVPEGSYKVQGLNIPARKVLTGAGQFATILYGYGDDVIKFAESSYNNTVSDLQINADAGYAAIHCKYAPASGDPFDSHNRIENVRTSGGKYGFFIEYPSRGVMIVNGYASGVSETLFYIQGTDNNLVSCGGQDANIGYELQNNNVMTSCSCFNISDRAVIVRGNWCQVVNFAGQDCQNGLYVPSKSNFITGKLDRMGHYTPGNGYDLMITENSRNNTITLTTTEGRTPSHDDSNGKSYVQYVLQVSNASASGNLINITTELVNGVSPILCSRGGEGTFTRNNKVYVNGDLMSASRDRRISRQEIVDVSVTDGGNFTPQTSGYLLVTVIHDETTNYANCEIKTSDYYNSAQQVIYNKQGYSRLRETVMVPVFAFEKIIFTVSNATTMSMTAKFIPFK